VNCSPAVKPFASPNGAVVSLNLTP
jgi:hypothetical protein